MELDEVNNLRDEARAAALVAAQKYLNSLEIGDQVVTGFILAVESIGSGGVPQVNWATGNGDSTSEDFPSGLAAPRIFGIIRIIDIDVDDWSRKTRGSARTESDDT